MSAQPRAAGSADQSRLREEPSFGEFATGWLARQCGYFAGAIQGLVVSGDPLTRQYSQVASWPAAARVGPGLASCAELALAESRGVINRASGGPLRLAVPLVVNGVCLGVTALEIGGAVVSDRAAMVQLEWGVAGLREFLLAQRGREAEAHSTRVDLTLDSLIAVLEQSRFDAAAQAAVSELALRLGCERVSLGVVEEGHCRVTAISQSAQFSQKVELTHSLASAMDEALEQRRSLLYPQPADQPLSVVRAQERLARRGAGAVLTIPFTVQGRFAGALVAERAIARPFDQSTVDQLGAAAAILGPLLEMKRSNDQPLLRKAGTAWQLQVERWIGPEYVGRKLAAGGVALLLLLALMVKADYRVVTDARVEGRIQRAVVAPYDGFIRAATARAGDVVSSGQELAALDDRDLTLERINRITERQQRQLLYDRAMGEGERVESGIARTQIDESNAQISLLDTQIARAHLTAPFKGVIVSGDLSRSIGATVRRGDILFQIAPLDEYRVVLSVDESQIADVHERASGTLLTTSLPDEPFALRVERITPVAEARDGRTVFRVEAALRGRSSALRPGMEGVAKIEVERRRVVWMWSRTLLDWLRLHLWAWWA
jgi:hypothetical protein